jgi:hypothetical protein
MKRSALPLSRYVLRKPRRGGGWRYFLNVPMWARKAGCPVTHMSRKVKEIIRAARDELNEQHPTCQN